MGEIIIKILNLLKQFEVASFKQLSKHYDFEISKQEEESIKVFLEIERLIETDASISFGRYPGYRLTKAGNEFIGDFVFKKSLDAILTHLDKEINFYSIEEICKLVDLEFDRRYKLILIKEELINNIAKSKDGDGFKITEKGQYFLHMEGGFTGKFYSDLNNHFIAIPTEEMNETNKSGNKKFFISHSKEDRNLADRVIRKLLMPIFQIKETDFFYTSNEETGIKVSEKWLNVIKNSINECEFFLPIISQNFKESEMCLYELGAAWGLNKKILPIIVEPLKFTNSSIITQELQQAKINQKASIKSLVRFLSNLSNEYPYLEHNEGVNNDEIIIKFLKSVKGYNRRVLSHLFSRIAEISDYFFN